MILPYVDLTKKPQYPKLYLARPDKTIVARIKEAYNINLHLKLGNISELTFDVPYYLEQNHTPLVKQDVQTYNPHIDFCLERYLVKCVNGNYTEWFTINQVTNYMNSEQEEGKKLHAYSLAYELRNKLVKNYKSQVLTGGKLVDGSVNATSVLTDALSNTNWTIGTVDSTFNLLYRQFNVTAKTGLDFVYEIATSFGSVIVFDTNLRTVSLYQLDNIGLDRGLRISYGQLLRTLEHTSNPDEMVTRLKPFGKSELTISGVNLTGSDYIEDFTFFLDNYTQDINGNALTHSRYMSDGLCKAILAYNAKITNYSNPTPSTPLSSIATGTGSTLPVSTILTAYSWVNTIGKTYVSPSTPTTVTAGQNISVTTPTIPTGVTGVQFYASNSFIANPASALILAQDSATTSPLTNTTYYVAYDIRNSAGQTTVGSSLAPILLSASGHNITTSITLPTGASSIGLYVGTTNAPLLLATISSTGTILYSGNAYIGISVTVAGSVLSITISGVATATGLAQAITNTTNSILGTVGTVVNVTGGQAGITQIISALGSTITLASPDTFPGLLSQLTSLQTLLTTQKNALADLNTQMAIIRQNFDIAFSTSQPTASLLTQQTAQQALIDAKNSDISTTNTNITNVNTKITAIGTALSITSNFTTAQITERTDYIFERQWVNTNFSDGQSLYDAAVKQFNTLRLPQLVSKIDVVNFLEVLEEQAKWDKLNLGDLIHIVYKQVNINSTAKIVEIQFSFEDGAVTLTISNVQNILTDKQKFIQNLNHSISTSAEVQTLKDSWNNIDSVQSSVNQILTQTWDSSKVAINSAVGQSVTNDARGLTIRQTMDSSGNPIPVSQQNKFIRATNGVIGLTQDGGNSFSTAIDATGVYAPRLVGQILAGTNLTITNSANDFLVNQNGITITKTGTMSKIVLNSASGIAIQKNIGTVSVPSWSNVLSLDASGNISTIGNFTMTGGSIIVGGTTLIDATNKIIDFSQFTTKLGRISGVNNVDSINPSQINAGTISASISITSPTINGGTITGVTVTGSTINALNTLYVAANAPTGSYYSNGIQMGVSQSPYVLPATITYTQDQSIALSNLKITSHGDATIYADGAVNLNGIISTQGNMARINNASLSISGSSVSGMGYAISVDGNINASGYTITASTFSGIIAGSNVSGAVSNAVNATWANGFSQSVSGIANNCKIDTTGGDVRIFNTLGNYIATQGASLYWVHGGTWTLLA